MARPSSPDRRGRSGCHAATPYRGAVMRSPDAFDAFYAEIARPSPARDLRADRRPARPRAPPCATRSRSPGTTGARSARLDDPESWVRPHAHGRALRRHAARPWHRDKGLDDDVRATLEALSELSTIERKALVLTTPVAPPARRDRPRRSASPAARPSVRCRAATSQFAIAREVPSTDVRRLLEDLRGSAGERALAPQPPSSGARAPRVVVPTPWSAPPSSSPPCWSRAPSSPPAAPSRAPWSESRPPRASPRAPWRRPTRSSPSTSPRCSTDDQVERYDRRLYVDRGRRPTPTSAATDSWCPASTTRFADPAGVGALVRTFDGSERVARTKKKNQGDKTRTQEHGAAGPVDGHRVRRAVGRRGPGRGDVHDGPAVVRRVPGPPHPAARHAPVAPCRRRRHGADSLRTWTKQPGGISVGLARTGQARSPRSSARPAAPRPTPAPPPPVSPPPSTPSAAAPARARAPAARADRPRLAVPRRPSRRHAGGRRPAARHQRRGPWVGTDPERARTNFASTRCDNTQFRRQGPQAQPDADLPLPGEARRSTPSASPRPWRR